MKRVVVGLSGGVDSSVAAYVLKEQGYDVVGLFMKNWHDTTGVLHGDCPFDDDYNFAQMVARKLNIPFEMVDLSEQYRKRVVDYMFDEYSRGRTPNPDVLCNREIKFDEFLKAALKLDADYVATGHYCRKDEIEVNGKTVYRLLAGVDPNKDQSYFLCQLNQEQLTKALFPIGDVIKPEVRRIATELGLATAQRKDSQGICFVGKVDLPVFLQQKLVAKKGDIIEIPKDFINKDTAGNSSSFKDLAAPFDYNPQAGKKVGTHQGAHFYTIGQRKGLNVGGTPEPLFVLAIDVDKNIVYVGQGQDHPGLYRSGLLIPKDEIHWVRPDMAMQIGEAKDFLIRIRYRQPLQQGRLHREEEGMYITFTQPQRGITSGQFAAWYLDDELIGSGVIV
ncbi:tRNA 2-thiouridine(34) synthase MnmA [Perlabentimonas gracilis]|uniref:tRNA 2-thiouridine(34) synthase MnmA n=1 Tax=Perlabentimonas gracilis TaxID=2715279 RepID=UPI00140CA2A4|nr:tRNA 2-thiouridine(34) synthase MnmA [Perlabentimonas gracilis]NHB68659.1 tRNA 2-thiouridine(34) synthase MnmA [Perlabentimonas gracilis]